MHNVEENDGEVVFCNTVCLKYFFTISCSVSLKYYSPFSGNFPIGLGESAQIHFEQWKYQFDLL